MKQLIGQNQGVSTIESNDPEIKNFERIARKYGVDYAVKKVKTDGNQNGRQTEVRHILQGKRRGRFDSSLHGILKKDRGEREKAVGSQKAQGFVSRSQRQSSRADERETAGAVEMKSKLKKTLISSVPYVFIALIATKLGQTWRLADGITVSEKFLIWYIACSKKSYIFTN